MARKGHKPYDGDAAAGAAAEYEDGYDEEEAVPSQPTRPRRQKGRGMRRARPTGPSAWTPPTSAQAAASGARARMRSLTGAPRMPQVPQPEVAPQQGWLPGGLEAARPSIPSMAVQPSVLEDLELPVYLPGLDELKDIPLASIGAADQTSWWEKFFWGKPIPEDVQSMDIIGQLAVNMFWRWGAEAFYELPKIPERQQHMMAQSGGWVTFSLGGAGGAGTST